jgi:hypothetical protein
MDNRDQLVRLFAEQPELISIFPPEIIPPERLAAWRETPDLAIAEIAGRDSIAAAIKLYRDGKIKKILPTVAYNGAQYGSLESVYAAVELLRDRIGAENVFELVALGSPKFWQALNLRFADALSERFGFYTPYVGCHLYIHAVRVPLAKQIGASLVISGERESHNGQIKINQTATVLDYYGKLLRHFDIELAQPLRYVSAGAEVVELLGCNWKGGERQLHCVLSGNYKNPDGSVDFGLGRRFSDEKSARFLEGFGLPLAQTILGKLLRGESVDYERDAAQALARLTSK